MASKREETEMTALERKDSWGDWFLYLERLSTNKLLAPPQEAAALSALKELRANPGDVAPPRSSLVGEKTGSSTFFLTWDRSEYPFEYYFELEIDPEGRVEWFFMKSRLPRTRPGAITDGGEDGSLGEKAVARFRETVGRPEEAK
jgi:hypothetical protein